MNKKSNVFTGNPLEMRLLNLRFNFWYIGQKRGAIDNNYGYKIQHSYPRSRLITWRLQRWKKKNYQDEDKKFAINKKFNVLFSNKEY